MRRREILALLAGATAGQTLAAAAQQARVPRIGVLVAGNPNPEVFWRLFRDGLRELGYVEGQNIRFEFRSAEGDTNRLPGLAAELVRQKVDVIVTLFTPTAQVAKQATSEIPIVMALTGDPVGNRLIDSLAHPGGNVTGIASVGPELAGKLVELIKDMLPSARQVAVLVNALDPFSKPYLQQIQTGGKTTAIEINPIIIHGMDELEAAFPAVEQARPDALIVQASLPTKRATELALKHRIPTASNWRKMTEEGGLMSYSVIEAELYRRAAVFVDKILKGAKPADLPVEQPTRFELVINLNTAKALGVTIPQSMLQRADHVIE